MTALTGQQQPGHIINSHPGKLSLLGGATLVNRGARNLTVALRNSDGTWCAWWDHLGRVPIPNQNRFAAKTL